MEKRRMHLEIIREKPLSPARPVPVLFVHGMWFGAWCWAEHFMPFFSRRGYDVYALSLRGHGGSEKVEKFSRVSLDDYLDDLVEAVGSVGHSPVLIGHSMGGLLVRNALERIRPAAAVLMASVAPMGVLPATLRIFRRYPLEALMVNLLWSMKPLVETRQVFRELFLSEQIPDRSLSDFYSRAGEDSYRAYLGMLAPHMKKPEHIVTPLLFLGAENDMIISAGEVRRTARHYGVEAEIFPGMAHCMMLDIGWERVAERIADWLDSQGI
jgi:pimeloyl-ACP methyl ester carboxylesterase